MVKRVLLSKGWSSLESPRKGGRDSKDLSKRMGFLGKGRSLLRKGVGLLKKTRGFLCKLSMASPEVALPEWWTEPYSFLGRGVRIHVAHLDSFPNGSKRDLSHTRVMSF